MNNEQFKENILSFIEKPYVEKILNGIIKDMAADNKLDLLDNIGNPEDILGPIYINKTSGELGGSKQKFDVDDVKEYTLNKDIHISEVCGESTNQLVTKGSNVKIIMIRQKGGKIYLKIMHHNRFKKNIKGWIDEDIFVGSIDKPSIQSTEQGLAESPGVAQESAQEEELQNTNPEQPAVVGMSEEQLATEDLDHEGLMREDAKGVEQRSQIHGGYLIQNKRKYRKSQYRHNKNRRRKTKRKK